MNAPLTLTPRSSLGSKFLMAVTGLGLTVFVIAHMLGNVQVFAGRDAVNSYAAALKHELPHEVRTLLEQNYGDERRHLQWIKDAISRSAWDVERPSAHP